LKARDRSALSLAVALTLAQLVVVSVRAEDECAAQPQAEECANWAPWLDFYAAPGTQLAVKTTLTQIVEERGVENAFVMAYASELYTTLRQVTGHVALFGSIGGGSARTEGSLGGTLDFGFRSSVTPKSGPFLRVGLDGYLLGNKRLYVSVLEPIQGRAGYQWLDGSRLLEAGLTAGYVLAGRFDASGGERDLGDSSETGAYAALHLRPVRVDVRYQHLARRGAPGAFHSVRAALCGYPDIVALCTDFNFMRGDSRVDGSGVRARTALYVGFSVGLALQ